MNTNPPPADPVPLPPLLPPGGPGDTAVVAQQEPQIQEQVQAAAPPPVAMAEQQQQQAAGTAPAWEGAAPPAPGNAVAGLPPAAAPGPLVPGLPPPRPIPAQAGVAGQAVGAGDHPLTGIDRPTNNDCLLGRGGGTNHHPGNKRYRSLTETYKPRYTTARRPQKPAIAREVVRRWRDQDPPGRFLVQDPATGLWSDVGDDRAREKTSQALRERMRYALVNSRGEAIGADGGPPPPKKQKGPTIDPPVMPSYAGGGFVHRDGPWSEGEARTAQSVIASIGFNWREVARVVGRTEDSVKNWWYRNGKKEASIVHGAGVDSRKLRLEGPGTAGVGLHAPPGAAAAQAAAKPIATRNALSSLADAAEESTAGPAPAAGAGPDVKPDPAAAPAPPQPASAQAPRRPQATPVPALCPKTGTAFPVGYKFVRLATPGDEQGGGGGGGAPPAAQEGEVVEVLGAGSRKCFFKGKGVFERLTVKQLEGCASATFAV